MNSASTFVIRILYKDFDKKVVTQKFDKMLLLNSDKRNINNMHFVLRHTHLSLTKTHTIRFKLHNEGRISLVILSRQRNIETFNIIYKRRRNSVQSDDGSRQIDLRSREKLCGETREAMNQRRNGQRGEIRKREIQYYY